MKPSPKEVELSVEDTMAKKPYRDNYEYARKNYQHYHLKVPNHEEEVNAWIMVQDNKNRFIIDCIKEHIERSKQNGGTREEL